MDPVRPIALVASLVLACPAAAQTVGDWRPLVTEASQRFGVPVAWIEQVMQAESGGKTVLNGRPIVSPAGAMGLMQLMPGTWAEMRDALGLGRDPFDPRDNILAGTAYLRRMYDRFGYPGMFAAYNAGPGRYAAYLAGRQSLPVETIAYLAITARNLPTAAQVEASGRTLFVTLRPSARASAPESPAASPLFFPVRERR
ncbi:MAG: lytic transglycosylase domain-containing protein [Pseudomonadota bacterium]